MIHSFIFIFPLSSFFKLLYTKNMKKIVRFLPFLLLVAFVFWNSLQIGEVSEQLTAPLEKEYQTSPWIDRLVFYYEGEEISTNTRTPEEVVRFFFRKLGHFVYFGLIALSALWMTRGRYLLSILLTLGVAIVDEAIQSFVPGRHGSWTDVGIDMSGACTLLFLYFIYQWIRKNVKRSSVHT